MAPSNFRRINAISTSSLVRLAFEVDDAKAALNDRYGQATLAPTEGRITIRHRPPSKPATLEEHRRAILAELEHARSVLEVTGQIDKPDEPA